MSDWDDEEESDWSDEQEYREVRELKSLTSRVSKSVSARQLTSPVLRSERVDWGYVAFSHTDPNIFFLQFCAIGPQSVWETGPITDVIDGKYDEKCRLMGLVLWNPVQHLGCDLDVAESVHSARAAGKPPLQVRAQYNPATDTHSVYFTPVRPSDILAEKCQYHEDVYLLKKDGLIVGVKIKCASRRIRQQLRNLLVLHESM